MTTPARWALGRSGPCPGFLARKSPCSHSLFSAVTSWPWALCGARQPASLGEPALVSSPSCLDCVSGVLVSEYPDQMAPSVLPASGNTSIQKDEPGHMAGVGHRKVKAQAHWVRWVELANLSWDLEDPGERLKLRVPEEVRAQIMYVLDPRSTLL